jgi:glucose-6-phosphate isomerase
VKVTLSAERAAASAPALSESVAAHFASRLWAADATLWGPIAESEASIRLGWVSSPERWRPLAGELETLRQEFESLGVTRVILCGMGGSSLAPEVMARSSAADLRIVDSTHPDEVVPLLEGDLSQCVVVVSSKSGGTLETDSQRRVFEQALRDQGLDPRERMVIVTDPDSPLHQQAREAGYRVFLGDETIGGRFSALSPFGLVPAALAGIDIGTLLTQATSAHEALSRDELNNPGLALGAALAVSHPQRNKLLLGSFRGLPGLGDWIEQLVAESTGKEGRGLLPVVDSHLSGSADGLVVSGDLEHSDISVEGTLGEHFLVWEFATAFACQLLGVNPFDQPNVESAKIAAKALLDAPATTPREERDIAGVLVWSNVALPEAVSDIAGLVRQWKELLAPRSYAAVCVFGDRTLSERWSDARRALETELQRPITLGFGPRFLHSTGQFHKGGPAEGVFLQIIQTPRDDHDISGREFTLGTLLAAQAHGDAQVLADAQLPVMSITASREQLEALWEALGA